MPINSFLYPGAKFVPPYEVANSLRFNDDSSDYLDKSSYATATSTKKFTWSCWFKLGEVGARGRFFDFWKGSGSGFSYGNGLFFTTGHELGIGSGDDSNGRIITTRKFRDPSAWHHVVAVYDSANSTAGDRLQLYVNGVRETDFSANVTVTQNWDYQAFTSDHGGIGVYYDKSTSSEFFDGYMAEVVFIDGQALDHTSFGEFDSDTNIWKPIDVSGLTFGNNGFYLDFENSSSLGADVSGNGNNFTANNLTSIDQSTDTCTNNFATMNVLDNYHADGTFSNGNLEVTSRNTGYTYNTSTFGVNTGKWYWEVKWSAQPTGSSNQVLIGIAKRPTTSSTIWLGSQLYTYGYQGSDGHVKNNNGNATGSSATTYSVGDIISVALDLDNNKLHFAKNGSWTNSSDPAGNSGGVTITAPDSTSGDSGFYFAAFGDGNDSLQETGQFNFGSPIHSISSGNSDANGYGNFEYSVPSGYYALNSKNLAEYG